MVKYLKRIIDDDLDKYLTMIGAVLIIGPKWCGKTTTAERHAKSVLKLQDKDNYKSNMMWADIEPSRLLKGEKPRLIDEWQVAPVLWDAVRTSVDNLHGLIHQMICALLFFSVRSLFSLRPHCGCGRPRSSRGRRAAQVQQRGCGRA